MKTLSLFLLCVLSVGCAKIQSPPPQNCPASLTTVRQGEAISPLDGKPNSKSSLHSGHVFHYTDSPYSYRLDDGSYVELYFTGGTSPNNLPAGIHGTIYVSVPSFIDDDDDNTYYFKKFVPDHK